MTSLLFAIFVGFIGTLIGAGGGFLIVPYLLLIKGIPTEIAVGTSLFVVFFNAISGSFTNIRLKRIDYKSACYFLLSCIPGAIVGTLLTGYFSGRMFQMIFGFLLLLVCLRMIFGNHFFQKFQKETNRPLNKREWTDKNNISYSYSFSVKKGIFLSFFVGVYSGLFGVGGGILHVPLMIGVLSFPVPIATATSLFILIFTSLSSTFINILHGNIDYHLAIIMTIGIIMGSQVASLIAHKIKPKYIKILIIILLIYTAFKMIL
jgi:hypothetical protein